MDPYKPKVNNSKSQYNKWPSLELLAQYLDNVNVLTEINYCITPPLI